MNPTKIDRFRFLLSQKFSALTKIDLIELMDLSHEILDDISKELKKRDRLPTTLLPEELEP